MSNLETWISLADEILNSIAAGFSLAAIIRKHRNHGRK